MKGDYIREMEASIMGIPTSRSIVRWMFEDEVTIGKVSDVFDFDNQIVVAIVTDIRKKGYLPLEDVKEFIKPLVIRDVKAKQLISKLSGSKDINNVATENNVTIETAGALSFNTYSLPKYGPEQFVQGHMFAAEKGSFGGPVKGDQGVYVFQLDNIIPAPENKVNYRFTIEQVRSSFEQMAEQSAYNAIDEAAEIIDFRKYVY